MLPVSRVRVIADKNFGVIGDKFVVLLSLNNSISNLAWARMKVTIIEFFSSDFVSLELHR